MIATLKSEFRKLTTIRSTWILVGLSTALAAGLLGFWVFGVKDSGQAALQGGGELALENFVLLVSGALAILLSFISVISVGNEYRYSTIMYTLTAARSRLAVFLSKLIAVWTVVLLAGAVAIGSGIAMLYLGWSVGGVDAVPQQIDVWQVAIRSSVALLAGAAYAFMITMLLRNQGLAIAVVLLLSSMLEGLLGILLKENAQYLPYNALAGLTREIGDLKDVLLTVSAYVVGFGILAFVLFRQRDAN